MRQRKEAEIIKERKRKEKIAQLDAIAIIPPKEEKENICSIVIRLPNGERVERRFYSNTTLEVYC